MNKQSSLSILSRLLGRNAEGLSPFQVVFAHLDKIQAGLSDKVVNYIETGDGRTVLATLQASKSLIDKILQDSASGDWEKVQARVRQENCLLFHFGGNPEGLARCVEALHWGCETQGRYCTYVIGKDEISPLVAEVIGRFNRELQGEGNESQQTTNEDLIAATKLLGGRPAQLMVAIVCNYLNIKLRGIPVEQFLMEGDPVEVIEGLKMVRTFNREQSIPHLLKYSSATNPAYLGFLFEQLEQGSSLLRDAARLVLGKHDPVLVQQMAIDLLPSSKATARKAIVQVLGSIGSEGALAALSEHREKEKTQSVLALIDQTLALSATNVNADFFEGCYVAVDGSTVEIPPMTELIDNGEPVLTTDDLAQLKKLEKDAYIAERKQYSERGDNSRIKEPVHRKRAQLVFDIFTGKTPIKPHGPEVNQDSLMNDHDFRIFSDWILSALQKVPPLRALRIYLGHKRILRGGVGLSMGWPRRRDGKNWLAEYIKDGVFDLRHLIKEASALNVLYGNYSSDLKLLTPEQLIESDCTEFNVNLSWDKRLANSNGVWPLYAEHLDLLANFLPPISVNSYHNQNALRIIQKLPKLPKTLFQNTLFTAIGEGRSAREMAQAMLKDIPGVDETLIATLADKRQLIRGNAARFLADRGTKSAVPALAKSLKTEKSEVTRAEMISAIARLGGDTAPYLGREALLAEAEKLLNKLPLGKLDWLPQAQAPALTWGDGELVSPLLIDAWLRLASKLKAPGGSPLFDLYLDQLDQDGVAVFAEWLLTNWIARDIDTRVSVLGQATSSKGILALTHRASPVKLGGMIADYLKVHGARISQAKSLLEVLMKSGSPEAVQLLVGVSNRFKQRSLQKFASECVLKLAEERGWSEDELADRSVPSGGFEEDGTITLQVGEVGKCYAVRLDSSLKVKVFNPDGREVKNLPAGKDPQTQESKKKLSQAKKTIKTVTTQQVARLYGGMLAGRTWPIEDWRNDLNTHPILSRLTERVIWRGLNEVGEMIVSFRPTPEGDFFDAEGDDADLTGVVTVDLIHSALIDDSLRVEWAQHLKDFEVIPLFPQVSRPLQVLRESQKVETELTDRKGWLLESYRLRSAATKLGYDRGPIEDAGSFSCYQKIFRSAGITAQLNFTGSYVPEENIPAAIIDMRFIEGTKGYGIAGIKLSEVSPLLLSEVWNDLHEIANYGTFDDEWEKKGLHS
ncbi:DUF4132 domain-containing protein [Microbulbifer sp. PSTR4-B]|uniref:DUF4132 domain-containing protein n=1 Tax=Microbulbifer sp. PSTR4-B TaxID=3243396 RepID=UPI004039D427